ncbi:formylglycine-generating enzyme family protein [Catellatospora citrea]|uniref:formylglycine-generating enzyme family protein n=1 Tax=Catellatospora citrea TaxID=53366 RepID=UPI001EF396A9|nr:SUMF1/EgtB/PvdO family nonheme iron enzyme [Catellatospora citrea]
MADLLVTATPLTCSQVNLDGPSLMPVIGLNHRAAARLAIEVGGRLPTSVEWEWIAAGPQRRRFPWGEQDWAPHLARLRHDAVFDGPAPVGAYPAGATPQGVLDLAGNVWEWTASQVMGGGRWIRGGSYASRPLYGQTTFLNAVHAERCSPGIGIRVVRTA